MIVGVAFHNAEKQVLISMPRPNRHNNIFHAFYEDAGKQNIFKAGWTQGFVDENGKFYDRKAAAEHVLKIGQELTHHTKEEYEGRTLGILFSEDVW